MFKSFLCGLFAFVCFGGVMNGMCSVNPVSIEFKSGCPISYTFLSSSNEARDFAIDLRDAREDQILVQERNKVEHAVKTVLNNTLLNIAPEALSNYANIPEEKKPLIAAILWEIQKWLYGCNIDSTIYCLNAFNLMANNAFDKANLLLLSQCDGMDYTPLVNANWDIIGDAILMLKNEKNGHAESARRLLTKLKEFSAGELKKNPYESLLIDIS